MNEQIEDNSGAMVESTQKILLDLVKAMVDHEERVQVRTVLEQERVIFTLDVDSKDLGKIIGKQGRTARSLRTILTSIGMKSIHRFALDIRE